MNPRTRYSQIAAANAHATCVPMPSARARRYMRIHHRMIAVVRKKPAISHQPPSLSGGIFSPYFGAGGSSASQGSWRRNWIGLQFTDASMFSPMISRAMNPQSSDAKPVQPR